MRLTYLRRSGVAAILALGLTYTIHAEAAGPTAADQRVGRMTDMMMQMLPFGPMLDDFAAKNQAWPMQQKPDAVNANQLACLRGELSSAGLRKAKLAEVAEYARADASRFDDDMNLLDKGIAPVLGKFVSAGMDQARGGPKADPATVMKGVNNDQMLAITLFMFDPKYKPLRDLSGFGDVFEPAKSADEQRKKGEGMGRVMMMKLMIGAMKTCDVPPSVLF